MLDVVASSVNIGKKGRGGEESTATSSIFQCLSPPLLPPTDTGIMGDLARVGGLGVEELWSEDQYSSYAVENFISGVLGGGK